MGWPQVMTDKLKELLSECEIWLAVLRRDGHQETHELSKRIYAAIAQPAVEAAEIEVVGYGFRHVDDGWALQLNHVYTPNPSLEAYSLMTVTQHTRIVSALQASAMVVPDGLALMPRALTAENGAKAAMLGELVIRLERHCSSCVDEAGDLSCDECGGDVEYVESVSVDWPTIKDIYAKAVDLLAASPALGDSK